jgi:hypothetical protein
MTRHGYLARLERAGKRDRDRGQSRNLRWEALVRSPVPAPVAYTVATLILAVRRSSICLGASRINQASPHSHHALGPTDSAALSRAVSCSMKRISRALITRWPAAV